MSSGTALSDGTAISDDDTRWSPDRAHAWTRSRGWRVGCNFTPSVASNQLEMWRAETFDPAALERELDFAAGLGFTSVRIFLHDLLWTHEREGFLERIDRFLGLASARGIGALVVLFDGVWDPHPKWGPQPEPRPGIHNSRWLQSPGAAILGDPSRHDELAPYVQGVIDRFRDDPRIDGWDLFNEPDNPNFAYRDSEIPEKGERALELLAKTFAWARAVDPSQPLTTGLWLGDWSEPEKLRDIERFCLDHSDVISFHHYGDLPDLRSRVEALRRYERPLWCTEWLARGMGSRFDPHLAWMRDESVGAYCWGLVAGRTQTHLPWDSWAKPYTQEPDPWHHEILHADGTPYDESEVRFIRAITEPSRDT
ncbi:MAG: 1,4-beta-xylanase [Deltaproteobacteria bacterium]|nr:1,4-beta-xylanase [Deltaproteobacteria bacterium]